MRACRRIKMTENDRGGGGRREQAAERVAALAVHSVKGQLKLRPSSQVKCNARKRKNGTHTQRTHTQTHAEAEA